jgi:molybdenum cofactor biosynthesis protein B
MKRHKRGAPSKLCVAVLTVSDKRAAAMREGRDEDISGQLAERRLKEAGHHGLRRVVSDDASEIQAAFDEFIANPKVDAVIISGGTGIASRDVTIETLRPLFKKELPGFGETLRRVGYERVGSAAWLTRATAGVVKRKPVFCLPGAPNAVEVAMDLILPELGHLVKHSRE